MKPPTKAVKKGSSKPAAKRPSIMTGAALLLDIALTIALVVFLGTIALATTIERGIFK